jgi:trimethylamine---corrinoid protein Co-methyltransferase
MGTDAVTDTGGARRTNRRRGGGAAAGGRAVRPTSAYRRISNPFPPSEVLTEDHVAAIHQMALRLLEEHGVRVLLAEARDLYATAGASVDPQTEMVRIGRDVVGQAIADAPATIELRARNPDRDVAIGGRSVAFIPVGGAPHINDLDGGKRPGSMADFELFARLSQAYDVIHMVTHSVEPQDVALPVRHLVTTRSHLLLTDKVPFVYARGRGQVADTFAMLRIAHGVDEEAFRLAPRAWTVINTNSPRQIDVPMAMGLIDFARAGQVSVVTPFTLAGAMAPVTLAGALTLQHAEAMAAITLAELAAPGAPVIYGGFTSNVDMRSGSPAFGTPEYFKAAVASGQMARHLGVPWRSSAPTAANAVDAQASYETAISLFGALAGGANVVLHAAGWLEGGLTASPEKFIVDVEVLQMVAETFLPLEVSGDELAYEVLAEIQPGGHFFGAGHTVERYETAFYSPIVSDWSNFGLWSERGALDATHRANTTWKRVAAAAEPPPIDEAVRDELDEFVARRTGEGGSPPES